MSDSMRERLCRAACLADGLDPDRKYASSSDHPANAPFEYAWQEYGQTVDAILVELRRADASLLSALRDHVPVDGMEWEYRDDEAPRAWAALVDHVRTAP